MLGSILHSAFSSGMIFSAQRNPWTEKLSGMNRSCMRMCNKRLLSTNTVFNSRISPFKIKSEIQGSKIYLLKSLYKSDEILLFFFSIPELFTWESSTFLGFFDNL